jgi:hypothetical protein
MSEKLGCTSPSGTRAPVAIAPSMDGEGQKPKLKGRGKRSRGSAHQLGSPKTRPTVHKISQRGARSGARAENGGSTECSICSFPIFFRLPQAQHHRIHLLSVLAHAPGNALGCSVPSVTTLLDGRLQSSWDPTIRMWGLPCCCFIALHAIVGAAKSKKKLLGCEIVRRWDALGNGCRIA